LLAALLTRAGATVGTPRFMAPEQHFSQPVDASADQFSFCLSLYWALYGEFPYQGRDLGELRESMVTRRIADPPEGASVPRWLRQVLLRGLQLRPGERFPSMGELLVALRADPQAARRRLLRTALAVVAAAAVASTVVAGGLAIRAHRAASERARLAQQFGQEVEQIAALSRYGASLPLHDTQRERDVIRERMDQLKERLDTLGALAAGPGHEALGCGQLALERPDAALHELEAAWATGYRSPTLAYALGMVHGKLYQRALAELPKTNDEKLDAARRAEIARVHRDPALRYLREAGARPGRGKMAVAADTPEYVEGLIAMYDERYEDALRLARRSAERVLWPYEARTLEGDIHLLAGKDRHLKGDVAGAVVELDRAGEAYQSAAQTARSGFAALMGECQRLVETIYIQVEQDRSPPMTAVLSACDAAKLARPDDAAPLVAEARAWQHLARYQIYHGVAPTDAAEAAIRLGEQALGLDRRHVPARYVIGSALLVLAEHLLGKGSDPRRPLEQAIAHSQEALRIEPGFLEAYELICQTYTTLGDYQESRGDDAGPSYLAALEYARKAIGVSPGGSRVFRNLGEAAWHRGRWEMRKGVDPTASFADAERAFEQVTRISPALDVGYVNLCGVYGEWSDLEAQRGQDPRPRLEQSIASCRQAIQLDANYAYSHENLGDGFFALAHWQLEHGLDPTDALAQSRAALEHALTMMPDDPSILDSLGQVSLLEARFAARRRGDPTAAFVKAEALYRRALAQREGNSSTALRLLAELSLQRARWRQQQHLPVDDVVKAGLAFAARALEQNPRLADAAGQQGALELVAARATRDPLERAAAARRAQAALEKAIALDANLQREYRPLLDDALRILATR
jgi:serine/threonine-protein kinase